MPSFQNAAFRYRPLHRTGPAVPALLSIPCPALACLPRLSLRAVVAGLLCGPLLCMPWAGQALAQGTTAPVAPESASDTSPSFDILEIVVEGNTVLAVETIERAIYPHLGPARRFDDVEAARKALEQAYRGAGFGFASVDIPEQRADTGVIRLQVTEGRIARTRVTGARYFSQGYILERVAGAAEGQVPHLPTIQAQLLDVNRNADRRVTPLLRPGREPGTTEVDLGVEDRRPLHGSLTLNNQASRNTSATRLQAALSYDNLLQRDHSLGLQAVVSPEEPGEVQVLTASYSMPRGPAGLESLSFSITQSDSKVFAGVADTRLFGKGTIYSLRRSLLLELGENSFQMLTLGADYKDMLDTVQAGEGEGFPTPISYLPLSLGWSGSWRRPEGDWQLGATLSGGLRGLVNDRQEFADKRYQAKGPYALLRLDARHTRTLPWYGLRLRVQGELQLTADPLISNEQFVMGGVNSVRGYLEAEAVGDQGVRGSVQLSTPELAPQLGMSWLASASAYTFFDAAVAHLRRPLTDQDWRFRLMGLGVGGQLTTQGSWPLKLTMELGWPLLKRDSVGSDGLRVHANASVGF